MGYMRNPHLYLSAMRALLGLLFLGWLMIWAVMPTRTYRDKWSSKLESATISTFLGMQGTWILIITFPILFIAVVGCLYLHLMEKNRSRGGFSGGGGLLRRLRAWRRPAMVRGPLGVITGVELVFCIMFMILVIWALYTYITGGLSDVSSKLAKLQLLKWARIGVSNVAGEAALACGLAMWAVTFPRIRRAIFELFFYAHYLYIPFLFFYLLHVSFATFCLVLPGVYLFIIDRFLRLLQSRRRVRLLSARLLQSEAMELNFAKAPGFSYKPTSVVFIKVPSISSLQWHPFTVSSSGGLEPENLSVVIKKDGRWTQKLFELLSQPSLQRLEVAVEGPYSPGSIDFLSYDSLILVSGGSGITPFISIIRELVHHSSTPSNKTPTVLLIPTFKTAADLTLLHLLLPMSTTTNISQLQLQVLAFVTREQQPPLPHDPEAMKPGIRSIYLNPNPSDGAVAPVLGPKGWLWLAAVVSSSFLAFLFLIGILTRYYIYPIDHNTYEVYSYTKMALLYLLIMFWCIAVMAGFAVLWNKNMNCKEAEKELMPVRMTDARAPVMMTSAVGGEIESEALLGALKVHYGERPNLKKLLLEFGEKSSAIGVMASGPSSLRREVAAICTADNAENLHYNSLSFTW